MNDIGPELVSILQGTTTKTETQPIPTDTWEQIRIMHLNTPYSEFLQAFLNQSQKWRTEPRVTIDPNIWISAIRQQLDSANDMVTNFRDPSLQMNKPGKIFAQGVDRPQTGQEVMTRLYVGVDPRHAADAFRVLIEEMIKNGSMRDVDIAFNEEEVEASKITDNMLVIYEPLSRPDVLNKVLSAYRSAKAAHPDVFTLSPHQRETIMRNAFKRFKAVVDSNLSFVEMDPEDFGQSWDSGEVAQIRKTFGINEHVKGQEIKSDEEWLKIIKEREKSRVVLTKASEKALQEGRIKPGDQIEYKRKLTAPALVQRGTVTAKI